MKKRLLSLVLCLVMVFTLVPFSALEEGAPKAYDSWNFNFVHTARSRKPVATASTSLTGVAHNNVQMYGVLRFAGKGD